VFQISSRSDRPRVVRQLLLVLLLAVVTVSAASAQPTFSKAFLPATIGPGSGSTLTFTIDNTGSGVPLTGLAFTDVLPAGVTLATPASPQSSCGGTLSAPDGGGTVTLADGLLGGLGTCFVSVNVTSATPGTHMNVSGDLTSSAGNSGSASADLVVDSGRPGFTKSFSPSSVPSGSRATLTFTIDNTLNPSQATSMTFTDALPAGLEVADPANVTNTCADGPLTGGVVIAVPGTNVISLGSGGGLDVAAVAAAGACAVSVDVVATGVGALGNTSGELTSIQGLSLVNSGHAGDVLTATASELLLVKEFTDDPVPPGGIVTLELTITNFSRDVSATGIAFSDNLGDAGGTLSGLAVSGPLPTNPCGAGSTLAGTTTLTLTGGNLAPGASCTFSVSLQVPAAATPGVYPNTTTAVTGDLGGSPVVGNAATDSLFVFPAPVFTKTFLDSPVVAGGSTRLQFSITNTSLTSMATDISFIDELTTFLPFPVSVTLPAAGFCGGGASMSLIGLGTDRQGLFMAGGSLAAGASCTFEVTIDLPATLPAGFQTNVSQELTATVDGATVTAGPAVASFEVVAGPQLVKEFVDDPVLPGGTATLRFTLTHDQNASADATGIAFNDDLNAALTGLVAVGLPMNDVCGVGSQVSGTSTVSFTGGTLAPGASCQFDVTVQVPMAALAGVYTNTTSDVTATVSGLAVSFPGASDDLTVAGLSLAKQFTDDPVIPGGMVTLQFTITNAPGAAAASSIAFSDDLGAVASGLTFDPGSVPMAPCGVGSSIVLSSGNRFLSFSGGSLGAGEMCQFSVTVNVGAGVPSGVYPNSTQSFSAVVDGNLLFLANAADTLTVAGDLLLLTKTFLTNPVGPGAMVDLRFELTNLSLAGTATGITFTDDLAAALTGLQAVTLPMNGFCGAGSQLTGAGLLTLTGAELAPGASCIFTATLQVPAMPAASAAVNTTSQVTGTIGGLGVTGDPATDTLTIQATGFTKTFDGPTVAGGTAVLTFTIDNLVGTAVDQLGFVDDLGAALTDLAATGLPLVDPCGAGSTLAGTSVLTLSGGSLGPNGSCSFNVTVQVPAGATPGDYLNTTSDLSASGLVLAPPATATLAIEPPPTFAKVFAPGTIGTGGVSTLTFTIDNTASAVMATGLAFTDNLPAGVEVANPSNASTTCGGGTVTAVPGSGVVTLTGGTVGAMASCTVSVDVTGTASGSHVNVTGDLISSSGNSGTATATLLVDPPPTFSKAFSPTAVGLGEVTTLTFTIDNTASSLDATGLSFTDNLPAGMGVADPANASSTCGGMVDAVPGATSVGLAGGSVMAGAVCAVSVDVVVYTLGDKTNVTEILSSSVGESAPATAVLAVSGNVTEIPTLGGWGLLLLAFGLALAAAWKVTQM